MKMKDPKEISLNDLIKIRRETEERMRKVISKECKEFRKQTGFSICSINVWFLYTDTIGQLTQEHIIKNVECEVNIK